MAIQLEIYRHRLYRTWKNMLLNILRFLGWQPIKGRVLIEATGYAADKLDLSQIYQVFPTSRRTSSPSEALTEIEINCRQYKFSSYSDYQSYGYKLKCIVTITIKDSIRDWYKIKKEFTGGDPPSMITKVPGSKTEAFGTMPVYEIALWLKRYPKETFISE